MKTYTADIHLYDEDEYGKDFYSDGLVGSFNADTPYLEILDEFTCAADPIENVDFLFMSISSKRWKFADPAFARSRRIWSFANIIFKEKDYWFAALETQDGRRNFKTSGFYVRHLNEPCGKIVPAEEFYARYVTDETE